MEAMNSIAAQVNASGAALVAISPQTEKQAYFMYDQHKFAFPLLVDVRNEVARKFGLVYRVPEEQQAIYQRTFVNLPFVNGDGSWELPIPATYVIDRDGTILFASANEDYTERPEPFDILASLEQKIGLIFLDGFLQRVATSFANMFRPNAHPYGPGDQASHARNS
jgi:peroxiredoxin